MNVFTKGAAAIMMIASLATLNVSCQKNRLTADDQQEAVDNNTADAAYTDAGNIADDAAMSAEAPNTPAFYQNTSVISTCAIITRDTLSNPHKIIVDFGTTNCLCKDGKYRRGKVLVSYTGRYRDAGTVITITFDDYFVNDNKIDGSKVITNMGLNGNGHPEFSVSVQGTITFANNGGTRTWTSSRVREWIAGYNTAVRSDDIYLITGTSSGMNKSGNQYTATITKAIRKELSCKWPVSGTIEISSSDRPTRTIDFGNGTCDDQATVTVGSRTRTITLK